MSKQPSEPHNAHSPAESTTDDEPHPRRETETKRIGDLTVEYKITVVDDPDLRDRQFAVIMKLLQRAAERERAHAAEPEPEPRPEA